MTLEVEAQSQLDSKLKKHGLSRKVSYTASEVKKVLGLSNGTFFRMIHRYVVDPATGAVKDPLSMKAVNANGYRVSYWEIVAYLTRKMALSRRMDAPLPSNPPPFGDNLQNASEPCPHCGSRKVSPVQEERAIHVAFRCQSCLATGPVADSWSDALSGWNRRIG